MKKVLLLLSALIIVGITEAQTHWNARNFKNYKMVKGIILIDGEEQNSASLEIGAFCGEECRASIKAQLFPPTQQYVVNLSIGTDLDDPDETIVFRIFDHSVGDSGEELLLESTNNLVLDNFDPVGTIGAWYQFSFTTPAPQPTTYELPITGYGEGTGNYYLIASPIGEVSPGVVTNMIPTSGGYDLFYFDQTKENEWINYKEGENSTNPGFSLEPGKGYLYARQEGATLTFTGTAYSGDGTFDLVYSTTNSDPIMHGWNLMGNPFATTATVNRDCYVMGEGGSEIILSENRSVAAMQGVFVKALETETEPKVTFGQGNSTGDGAKVVLNIRKDRAATIDRAMVRFNDNSSLPKFMLDNNNTKIYIPQNGNQYAVVSSGNVNSLPVNFKARENGTYTLSIDINEVRMEYLHLLDNKTGADIDLLVQPDYQFTANNHDYEARFTLVFRAMTGIEEQIQQSFCFMNGRNLYFCEDVEGAILCLVDMTGRVVRNETLKGNGVNLSSLNEGVYVVRLNYGDNVKTQKVVVR